MKLNYGHFIKHRKICGKDVSKAPNIINIQPIRAKYLLNCGMLSISNMGLELELIYLEVFMIIHFLLITGILFINCFIVIV
jgi:hypothetical protein